MEAERQNLFLACHFSGNFFSSCEGLFARKINNINMETTHRMLKIFLKKRVGFISLTPPLFSSSFGVQSFFWLYQKSSKKNGFWSKKIVAHPFSFLFFLF
jgi:hypothetical protein